MTDDSSAPASAQTSSSDSGHPKKSGPNFSLGQALGAILLILVVVFIIENTDKVRIRIIAGPKVEVPVYVAILIAAVVGALIAALLRYRRKRHNQNK